MSLLILVISLVCLLRIHDCKTNLMLSFDLVKFSKFTLQSVTKRYRVSTVKPIKRMESLKMKLSDRLSGLVLPVNYNLKLHPNMEKGTFEGHVNIHVNVKEERKHIYLHTKFLDIKNVKVLKDNKDIPVAKFFEVAQLEQLMIHFEQALPAGHYHIDIDFSGSLTKSIVGFYASRYKDRTMVASKFEPTYARQAFPCFDEPEFKATFDIALVKPKGYTALSNMNEISSVHDSKTNTDVVSFARSVPMSTYLACFVLCEFDFKETEINTNGIGDPFTLRSYARKGETQKIDFAQSIGQRATEFYIKYYEVPFPLPKLDMIAIPEYQSGATEHWGLITYRETSFLIDDATASTQNRISVANTIVHELAHMWFGNLVTMKWWDDLWLNEGFATYMQVKALDAIEPSWTMLDQFLTKTMHSVLVSDAKLASHAIVQTVETPDEITAIFDAISYNKGSSVLRMLEGFVGEENFRRGVSDYLKRYKYGNTVTQDLLASLEPYFKKDHPDLNLTLIMDTWTRQTGYPVLTVTPGDAHTLVVSQARFLLDRSATYNTRDNQFQYRWFVPITYKTNQGTSKRIVWFPNEESNVTITLSPGDTWCKLNNNQVGYYRVSYTEEMWGQLIQQLKGKSEQLTLSDRAHLINDVFALATAEYVSYEVAMNLTTYLTVEEDYVPWDTADTEFVKLASRLENSLGGEGLRKYVQHLITPLYKKQSWDQTDIPVIQKLLRVRILSLAARFELPQAQSKVRELFLSWLDSRGTAGAKDMEPDLRSIVYFYGMKSASQAEWDKVWQLFLEERDPQEQQKLRHALSAPANTNILRKYLTLAWDQNNVRTSDYLIVVQYIANNPSGRALIWDEIRAKWPEYVKRFSLNSRYLGNLIPGISSTFDTEVKLQEMESFFSQYPEAGAGEAARRRALETLRGNIRWRETHEPTVTQWLNDYLTNL
uniref:Aminopeptidase n=1 Tax=Plutella xylostella TaxID=51655 RepID=A0A6G5NKS6_PLUXY|nr:aminopeptidase A isoform X2 [Plutella xylostella]